ncbi:MAG: phosphomannomutase/phosphoglucomutase [Patescibacteria group bacterium]
MATNHPSIFKAYDFRGKYPADFEDDFGYWLGRACAVFFGIPDIALGWDMRAGDQAFAKRFTAGANEQGVNVTQVGRIATDMIYFAAGHLNMPGVVFTASHNPAGWVGAKFCRAGASPVSEETGLKDIRALLESKAFPASAATGTVQSVDILPAYVQHFSTIVDVPAIRPLKIVADAGNGMAGDVVPKVFGSFPVEIIPMYFELDETFPNHPPSPIEPENVQDLIAKVQAVGADFGMAFDGDADRVYFIDENGGRISASFITAMIAERMLAKEPGASVVYNVPSSHIVREVVEARGGKAIRERVGHSFIKATMRTNDCIFGGEHSGHFFYRDMYFADSAIVTAAVVMEIVSKSGKKFSELVRGYERYFAIEETNFSVEDKAAVTKKLEDQYGAVANSVDRLDGITFEFEDWWFNVRGSNTEPKLRLNLEATTVELRDAKFAELGAVLKG